MLWTGILAGPLVWLALLQTNYVLSYVACELRQTWFLHAATGVSLVLVIAAGAVAWSGSARGPHQSRATWMAWAGVVMSLWFALVIAAMAVPILIVPPCAGR